MDMVQLYFGIKCFAAVFVLLFPLISKGTLTLADKKAIIREVKRNYPEFKWRVKK